MTSVYYWEYYQALAWFQQELREYWHGPITLSKDTFLRYLGDTPKHNVRTGKLDCDEEVERRLRILLGPHVRSIVRVWLLQHEQ